MSLHFVDMLYGFATNVTLYTEYFNLGNTTRSTGILNTTFSYRTTSETSQDIHPRLPSEKPKKFKIPPTILMWNWANPYQMKNSKLPDRCGGCRFTTNKTAFNESDVVILQDQSLTLDVIEFPNRLPHQVFVFRCGENPCHTFAINRVNRDLTMFNELFNMTITYRRDSDVTGPYGCWGTGLIKSTQNLQTTNKTKVAVIVASDCKRVGAKFRKIYTDELIKAGLKLDRYGKCFGPRYQGNLRELLTQYKFYLAFENGIHCRDYITEKFWRNSLAYGLVPVVWGSSKADVVRVAPPGSYVHVEDFNSPKEVAEYLDYLDKNDTAYQEYFKWRTANKSENCGISINCDLCNLVSKGHRGRPMKFTDWWFETENKECISTNMSEMTNYFNNFYGINER
uniref:4-galactosyl-N-acetylglucosaminide 3-alpha-L-fucosyltransferase FUT6-like n=1 Tax=Styela clava TaxID=7725 RepID=UPI00193AC72D|nr:4-galactosyl-N-acetylglucosaminide 3-alpha-L-fucosyltransferase FUT6-like [Styela clava]